jgi:hypothetical protein
MPPNTSSMHQSPAPAQKAAASAFSPLHRRFVSVLTKKRSEGRTLLFEEQFLNTFCNFVRLKEGK